MAYLGKKEGIYHVRFRYQGKEYKRSLKTRNKGDAEGAKSCVEQTIHRLRIGLLQVPPGVEPAEFIVSGGTITTPPQPDTPDGRRQPALPTTRELVQDYLKSQEHTLAPSYHYSQGVHLRHLVRYLGGLADDPCDRVIRRDLDLFLQGRLAKRNPNTVIRERVTLVQFYRWAVSQEYLAASPAATLPTIKGGGDRPPFRTVAEITRIIHRGGLSDEEILDLWECLYLSPEEIGNLLETVRKNAREDCSYLLHAVPAYTGMRRGEVLRLRWIDVDFDEGYVCARSRKQSRTNKEILRRIDLHPEWKETLLEWRRQRPKGQYLLCDKSALAPLDSHQANRLFWQPMRGTDWCLSGARNLFKVGFHTYRHSFASNLAAAGVDQRIIDEFMGHTTEAMRRRYRHLFPKDRRAAIESFSLRKAS